MITDFSSYVDFFRVACEKHVEILHNNPDAHFARITLNYDPLLGAQAQIAEFMTGRRLKLKEPIVLLISYQARYADVRDDNVVKALAGGLVVLKKVAPNDFDGEEAVFSETERIGAELLGYTDEKLDVNNTGQWLEWQRVASERLSDVAGYSGVRFDFEIMMPAYNEISWKPAQFGE